MNTSKTIVIVPTYNNPKTIKEVAFDVLNHGYEVIVIDDGSEIAIKSLFTQKEQEKINFVTHEQNQGKGQAILSGIQKAKELGFSHVLSMDGDGQHLASQAHHLMCLATKDEIIIGARNFDLKNVPFASKFGRWFSNMWACWDTGHTIEDSLSGYRIYPISILDLDIKTKRFDWEMEVLVRHADAGKKIIETPIECYYPTPEERVSHFRKFEDTMSIVWVHLQILPLKGLKKLFRPLLWFKKS
ncbi:MAG: glycosyltransferase family 2 protein [Sulfurovum sp.]